MRRLGTILVLLSAASCAGVWGVTQEPGPPAADEDLSVVFFPHREAVLSAEVSARVVATPKRLGQGFAKGDVLVRLDPTLFEARREKAEADLKTVTVELEAVEKLYRDRARSLVELMQARRAVAEARMNLKLAERDVASCTIRAPYDGRVVKCLVNEHELVQRGQKLIAIVDDRVLRAQFLVPASAFRKVKIGQTVTIRVQDVEQPATGTITLISAVNDAASGTLEVIAEVDNKDNHLRAGMIGTLKLSAIGRQ